jgi:hypothetical protein
MPWRRALLAVCVAAVPIAIEAQPRRAQPDSAGDAVRWQFDQCMGGLTYGAPLKWALSYGMGYVRESAKQDLCVLGAAKVGFGGASANVGIANSLGAFGSGTAITAGVLRTFDRPLSASPRRTYVGASLHVWPLLALGGEIGLYTRMGADEAGQAHGRRLVAWSFGFGF